MCSTVSTTWMRKTVAWNGRFHWCALGTKSIVEMATGPKSLEAFRRPQSEGELGVRAAAAVALNDNQAESKTPEESETLLAREDGLETPLTKLSLEYWADGSPLSKRTPSQIRDIILGT